MHISFAQRHLDIMGSFFITEIREPAPRIPDIPDFVVPPIPDFEFIPPAPIVIFGKSRAIVQYSNSTCM